MKQYEQVYIWDIFNKLKEGRVYLLDKQKKKVFVVSGMTAGELSEVMNDSNTNGRYEAWIEKWEGTNE